VKDGMCRMGRGSLGEVLPASVKARFVAAAVGPAIGQPALTIARLPALPAGVDDFGPLS
jgi:hypothetical protein